MGQNWQIRRRQRVHPRSDALATKLPEAGVRVSKLSAFVQYVKNAHLQERDKFITMYCLKGLISN